MDPKFIGTNLTTEEKISGSEYILQLTEVVESASVRKILLELVEYQAENIKCYYMVERDMYWYKFGENRIGNIDYAFNNCCN